MQAFAERIDAECYYIVDDAIPEARLLKSRNAAVGPTSQLLGIQAEFPELRRQGVGTLLLGVGTLLLGICTLSLCSGPLLARG